VGWFVGGPILGAPTPTQLASLLDLSLGEDYARVLSVSDDAEIRRLTFSDLPLVALVDGRSPPHDAESIAAALGDMPSSVVRAIWAADAPEALFLTRALADRGVYTVDVAHSDGLDPLLDLVRSRRRTSASPPA
jgi:hypothetical protein